MHRHTIAALSAAILAGCATPPPEPTISTYSYESKEHTGTVYVTDKHYLSDALICPGGWREGEVYQPTGVPRFGADSVNVNIKVNTGGQDAQRFVVDAPQGLTDSVVAKDFQQSKSYMLGVESNGLITQGENFYYPEGYFVRVGVVSIKKWTYKACIGIDHMYVLNTDLESMTNPPIYLDRVVVPYAMQRNGLVKVSFGSKLQHTVEIRVQPK